MHIVIGLVAKTFLPMTAPAVLRRCACCNDLEPCGGDADVEVAKGPLIIMAHGLMAIDAAERARFRITSLVGEFSADDIARLLHQWRTPARSEADPRARTSAPGKAGTQ